MALRSVLARAGLTTPWSAELGIAVVGLLIGVGLMPVLIFYAGVATLGRYDGASLGTLYRSLMLGLGEGSLAAWAVLLGPYGLYVLFKALRAWWRASARLT